MKVRQILVMAVIVGVLSVMPLVYAQMDHDHHGHDQHSMTEAKETKDLGICPVMEGKAQSKYHYNYQGKDYYFCCPSCIETFKADPDKYISKVKEFDLEAYQFDFEPKTITVKKGDIVRLHVKSRDVPHGIYIKEYGINVPVTKEAAKKVEFIADKAGTFAILCSVYCGSGHQAMQGKLIVEGE